MNLLTKSRNEFELMCFGNIWPTERQKFWDALRRRYGGE